MLGLPPGKRKGCLGPRPHDANPCLRRWAPAATLPLDMRSTVGKMGTAPLLTLAQGSAVGFRRSRDDPQ